MSIRHVFHPSVDRAKLWPLSSSLRCAISCLNIHKLSNILPTYALHLRKVLFYLEEGNFQEEKEEIQIEEGIQSLGGKCQFQSKPEPSLLTPPSGLLARRQSDGVKIVCSYPFHGRKPQRTIGLSLIPNYSGSR